MTLPTSEAKMLPCKRAAFGSSKKERAVRSDDLHALVAVLRYAPLCHRKRRGRFCDVPRSAAVCYPLADHDLRRDFTFPGSQQVAGCTARDLVQHRVTEFGAARSTASLHRKSFLNRRVLPT